jgi:hypothetical protein
MENVQQIRSLSAPRTGRECRILNSAAFDSIAKIAFLIPNLVGRPFDTAMLGCNAGEFGWS